MTDWTPGQGDVAIVSWQSKSGRHGGTQLALRCSDTYAESHWQSQAFGIIADDTVTTIRPLVVLDPENREQVKALDEAYQRVLDEAPEYEGLTTIMEQALRSLVTPPRPAEPTGLGAVVIDTGERAWVRVPLATNDRRWFCRDTGEWAAYTNVAADRVLSEGI